MKTNTEGSADKVETEKTEPTPEMKMKPFLMRLYSVMKEVGRIEKDKRNEFQKYDYASENAIKTAMQPLLIQERLLFHLDITDYAITDVKTSKGEERLTTARFSYKFIDIDSGEKMEGTFVGSGQDAGDKGIYKATTGAIKYIMTSTFLIPTGDDPEAEKSPKNVNKAYAIKTPAASADQDTTPACGLCNARMYKKNGPNGEFWSCPNWNDGRKHPTIAAAKKSPDEHGGANYGY